MANKALRLLKNWENKNDVLRICQLPFLLAIFNKLGLAEKAISYMNSIPEKVKCKYPVANIQLQILAMCSYDRLKDNKKTEEMFHKIFALISNEQKGDCLFE
jgi:hypothetical protein